MSKAAEAAEFELYALAVLRAQAAEEGGDFIIGNELPRAAATLDALAPEGVLGLRPPTLVKIRSRLNLTALRAFLDRLPSGLPRDGSVLVVARVAPGTARSLQDKAAAMRGHELRVLSRRELDQLAKRHPAAAAPFDDESPAEVLLSSLDSPEAQRERRQNLQALAAAFRKDRLAPFLGAGVSVSAGLPDWPRLLKRLATRFIRDEVGNSLSHTDEEAVLGYFESGVPQSPLIVARLLREGLGKTFGENVRKAIYQGGPSPSDLLTEIGALCVPGRTRQGPPGVVTFNFDTLLEDELSKRALPHASIFQEGQEASPSELPIYHVHGFLPKTDPVTPQHVDALVFSEDAYHTQFADPYSWNNVVQLNLLRSHVCLFVGLSMSDPNLRRLLEITVTKKPATKHYTILKDRWSEKAGELGGSAATIPNVFRALEEQSLARLGVSVIWVTEYDEIPEIIAGVRAGGEA